MTTSKKSTGTRIQLHPAMNEWMQGDKYGEIVGLGHYRQYRNIFTGEITKIRPYRVKLDKSGRIIRVHPENIFTY